LWAARIESKNRRSLVRCSKNVLMIILYASIKPFTFSMLVLVGLCYILKCHWQNSDEDRPFLFVFFLFYEFIICIVSYQWRVLFSWFLCVVAFIM
jgi:hypothetical protein